MTDGAHERIDRLGLGPLLAEVRAVLTGFQLLVEERRDANGGAFVRKLLDDRFDQTGGWSKKVTGDVDWTKCQIVNGTRVCVGVELQISGRSDLIISSRPGKKQRTAAASGVTGAQGRQAPAKSQTTAATPSGTPCASPSGSRSPSRDRCRRRSADCGRTSGTTSSGSGSSAGGP